MGRRILEPYSISKFEKWLYQEEKSPITVEKYLRDVRKFYAFAENREVTKELVMDYKDDLIEAGYAVRSINSMLASLNSFLRFLNLQDCCVKSIKSQRAIYCPESRELTKAEYMRLLSAAGHKRRLHLLIQTIGSTGIRVSELKYFTVEAVKSGEVCVYAKGKNRTILIPTKLKKRLLQYAKEQGIECGVIFRTRSGRAMDRSNIWAEMKKLCRAAGVEAGKVFPHNLRKLFARTFYSIEKDIAKLADLLGHSSIDTTRIYIVSTGWEHRRKIDKLGLVL